MAAEDRDPQLGLDSVFNRARASELTRLLARATPTLQMTNNLAAQPNHVHVIPPNAAMSIVDGVLKLQPRPQDRSGYRDTTTSA